ncbi:glycosyltransferase [Flavobacterium sp. GA093]|uniref:Glycosyltransferase n=1 Tax=Flavobacterium hydrocarbonoxydans TaxID=2683249 RepID=A0A6I4NS86_9FLAO|nr:glycosyltransferase [Flavobacterium hydrocarbonoxydans]MWB94529.1 glycosyltransferase [Flavobacterium hydrocarbonoxydans]
MKLLIVSTAPLIYKDNSCYAYSPYVNELILLEKFSKKIFFCCPVWDKDKKLLISKIPFDIDKHFKLIDSNISSFPNFVKAIFCSIYNFFILFKAMETADHIHLRCPGNIGLMGCLVQIFFPKKIKSAKYAGNWDPKSKQPWTYKLQKYILSNTFLTRNMQVLVYGEWENQSRNIKSFFTATYSDSERKEIQKENFQSKIRFLFVGSLVSGKNPLYAIQLIEELIKNDKKVILNIYGEGNQKNILENYIDKNQLGNHIFLLGNQDKETIKKDYQESHFVILPSQSEGWPKAIAEGMFWGCVPIVTGVSCIPFMLDYGKRGVLLAIDLKKDIVQVEKLILHENVFFEKSKLAQQWSQKYTTDFFESEIKMILTK